MSREYAEVTFLGEDQRTAPFTSTNFFFCTNFAIATLYVFGVCF